MKIAPKTAAENTGSENQPEGGRLRKMNPFKPQTTPTTPKYWAAMVGAVGSLPSACRRLAPARTRSPATRTASRTSQARRFEEATAKDVPPRESALHSTLQAAWCLA